MPKNTAADEVVTDRVVLRAQEIIAAQEGLTAAEAGRVLEDDAALLGRPVREIAGEVVNIAKAATHDPLQNVR